MNSAEPKYLPKKNVLQYAPRARKSRNIKKIVLIASASVIVALVSLGVWVMNARFFSVSDFSVSGERLLTADEVKAALVSRIAGESSLRKFLGENHIFFWIFARRDYAFSEPTELASVSLNPDFWSRKVSLTAVEREVAHIVCRPSEAACYGVTGEGIVFSRIPEVRGSLILRIEDEHPAPVVFGTAYFGDSGFLPNVYRTKEVLDRAGLTPAVIRVRDRALYEWEAVFPEGPVIYFSGFFVPKDLAEILRDIRSRESWNALSYVDFRVENKVFYR